MTYTSAPPVTPNDAALSPEALARLRALDLAHHLPAQADHRVLADLGGSRIITRAQGSTVWDAEGKACLDGMAGLWCVNVGYGRRELAEAAADQMLKLSFYNTFFKTATQPAVELAAAIAGKLGGELQHVFFNNSGSEAADTALRLVRHYWAVRGEPQRKTFITRWNGYHGSTVAGASLGGMKAMHAQGDLPIPGIRHIRQPYLFEAGAGADPARFAEEAADALEAEILEAGPDTVAAFMAEPVQGAGGVIIPPPGYWPRIEAICRRHGVLIVADEVICGFGRTGSWFGFQHYGFTPDVVTMAKGLSSGYLPISATAVTRAIADVLRDGGEFTHGFTYSGHPVAAAVALENLAILEREGLVARVRDVAGPHLARALAALDDHPLVGETRSVGLLGAVEIVADKADRARFPSEMNVTPRVRDAAIARGVMVRAVRDSLVMAPPFVVTAEEIDRLAATLRDALDQVAGEIAS